MTTRFETFAFLPPLSSGQVRVQIEHMLAQDQLPIVEFLENPRHDDIFWQLWPVPPKQKLSTTFVLAQIEACGRRFPYAYIRLSGYNRARRMNATSFIVRVPEVG